MPSDVTKKQQLPDCEECTGCTTNLTVLVRQAGHCAEGIQCTGGKGHRKQCEECIGCKTNLTVLMKGVTGEGGRNGDKRQGGAFRTAVEGCLAARRACNPHLVPAPPSPLLSLTRRYCRSSQAASASLAASLWTRGERHPTGCLWHPPAAHRLARPLSRCGGQAGAGAHCQSRYGGWGLGGGKERSEGGASRH